MKQQMQNMSWSEPMSDWLDFKDCENFWAFLTGSETSSVAGSFPIWAAFVFKQFPISAEKTLWSSSV